MSHNNFMTDRVSSWRDRWAPPGAFAPGAPAEALLPTPPPTAQQQTTTISTAAGASSFFWHPRRGLSDGALLLGLVTVGVLSFRGAQLLYYFATRRRPERITRLHTARDAPLPDSVCRRTLLPAHYDGHCHLERLATVERQLVMQCLDSVSQLALMRCNRGLRDDARGRFAWKYSEPIVARSHMSEQHAAQLRRLLPRQCALHLCWLRPEGVSLQWDADDHEHELDAFDALLRSPAAASSPSSSFSSSSSSSSLPLPLPPLQLAGLDVTEAVRFRFVDCWMAMLERGLLARLQRLHLHGDMDEPGDAERYAQCFLQMKHLDTLSLHLTPDEAAQDALFQQLHLLPSLTRLSVSSSVSAVAASSAKLLAGLTSCTRLRRIDMPMLFDSSPLPVLGGGGVLLGDDGADAAAAGGGVVGTFRSSTTKTLRAALAHPNLLSLRHVSLLDWPRLGPRSPWGEERVALLRWKQLVSSSLVHVETLHLHNALAMAMALRAMRLQPELALRFLLIEQDCTPLDEDVEAAAHLGIFERSPMEDPAAEHRSVRDAFAAATSKAASAAKHAAAAASAGVSPALQSAAKWLRYIHAELQQLVAAKPDLRISLLLHLQAPSKSSWFSLRVDVDSSGSGAGPGSASTLTTWPASCEAPPERVVLVSQLPERFVF